jgi:hypothetical protein
MALVLDDDEASHLRKVVKDLVAERDAWKRRCEQANAQAHALRIELDQLKEAARVQGRS